MSEEIPPLVLRRREDRRLRSGHPWIFSNEVDTGKSPLTDFQPGDWVNVRAHGGAPLGTAYVNPGTLIAARMVSRAPNRPLDRAGIEHRIETALSLRQRLFPAPFYRLVYGESDGLPGLVVDRHGDVVVAQIGTQGMERLRDDVVAALDSRLKPRALVLRNDTPARATEGLAEYVETVIGEAPDTVRIEENGARFEIDPLRGQKCGWFYDQRDNRARLARYVSGARVLDVFCYAGGFGIQAARAGALAVQCVDGSQAACEIAEKNAALNECSDRIAVRRDDAFDALKSSAASGERFDAVVLDPPAFARRRRDLKSATEAYTRLNRLAIQLLES
ncbi:MAG: class I SAM-dependent rRNA methyltransferase, partial [Gammaproteobacteria bacterium]|nr:class I SAM-dependent rRNA methyltransferase [Gammaproteobacteria bacterium]